MEVQEVDFDEKSEKKKKEQKEDKDKKKRKRDVILLIIVFILIILLCLFLRSCGAGGEEPVAETERVYEENCTSSYDNPIPSKENKRLNIALSESYHITDEYPVFYIGFPEENIFDVVFTIKDMEGSELYRTQYVAPGTNVGIDGTKFLEKGEQQVECLVSVYCHDLGTLISDCTTVVLNINYE
uniref:hypothetical protein n=1 Tax=Agathobacter sp. TaxID=2021311 RepID=UPI0040573797